MSANTSEGSSVPSESREYRPRRPRTQNNFHRRPPARYHPEYRQKTPHTHPHQDATRHYNPRNERYLEDPAHATSSETPPHHPDNPHTELANKIISRVQGNTYECMVCYDTIGRRSSIWSCTSCYALFHLDCILTWSHKSNPDTPAASSSITLFSNTYPLSLTVPTSGLPSSHKSEPKGWRCPGCQTVSYKQPEYLCFCGKIPSPPFDPYLLPHSCGDVCGKGLDRGPPNDSTKPTDTDRIPCPHNCALLCHPGPCPPCTAMGQYCRCYCGRQTYRLLCGAQDPGRSCEQACEALLLCGVHVCKRPCHPGACDPCDEPVLHRCYCGAFLGERTCGECTPDTYCREDESNNDQATGDDGGDGREPRSFSCDQKCGHTLTCGEHECKQRCHPGPCDACVSDPRLVSTCPCGRTPLHALPGGTRASCHDPIPTCDKACNKALPCGLHRCPILCHHGECPPCEEFVKVKCRCGETEQTVPCSAASSPSRTPILCAGVCRKMRSCGKHPCGEQCCVSAKDKADEAGIHTCLLICDKPLKCGNHTCQQLCHRGRCQPCMAASFDELACRCGRTVKFPPIACGTTPPECNHPCIVDKPCGHKDGHLCHQGACPPCMALVDRMCMGGHEVRRNVLCHMTETSCGKPCDKPLACGHTCNRFCHSGPCAGASSSSSSSFSSSSSSSSTSSSSMSSESEPQSQPDGMPSCGQVCGAKLTTCEHTCQAPCHPGFPCPVVEQCKQKRKVACACGRISTLVPCDTPESSPICNIPCDSVCEYIKKTKAASEVVKASKSYNELLMAFARVSPGFIRATEANFDAFMTKAHVGSKFKAEAQNIVQQRVIIDLAACYGFESQASAPPAPSAPGPSSTPGLTPLSLGASYSYAVHLTRTATSKKPLMLLSESAATVAKAKAGAFKKSTGKPCALHLYEVRAGVKTQQLLSVLAPFGGDASLHWVDDSNYLVVLESELVLINAQRAFETKGNKARPFRDATPPPVTFR